MNCFYFSRYRFYQPKLRHELTFFMISDVHFSRKVKTETLRAITIQAVAQEPNYIIIAGDLIDSLDCIDSDYELRRLTAWLQNLGKVATTLIGLGNHDFYRQNPDHSHILSTKRHWYAERPTRLIEAVKDIKNVYILDNEAYEDKEAYIFGFTQSPNYFEFDHDEEDRGTTVFNPGGENLDIMLADLDDLKPKLITKLPKKKAKIAIIHSPVYLEDSEVAAKLYEFDYTISGHMHNGVVPPVLNDFWRSDRGLVAPGKLLFPHAARSHITSPFDKKIILGPIATIQDSSKPLTFLNRVFPASIASLELTHNANYLSKPDVKHQYLRF